MLPIRIYRNRIIFAARGDNATGTAQAGTASTITLKVGYTGDALGHRIRIEAGTGAGQMRLCKEYVAATKVATVDPDWTTPPDATSQYRII